MIFERLWRLQTWLGYQMSFKTLREARFGIEIKIWPTEKFLEVIKKFQLWEIFKKWKFFLKFFSLSVYQKKIKSFQFWLVYDLNFYLHFQEWKKSYNSLFYDVLKTLHNIGILRLWSKLAQKITKNWFVGSTNFFFSQFLQKNTIISTIVYRNII